MSGLGSELTAAIVKRVQSLTAQGASVDAIERELHPLLEAAEAMQFLCMRECIGGHSRAAFMDARAAIMRDR